MPDNRKDRLILGSVAAAIAIIGAGLLTACVAAVTGDLRPAAVAHLPEPEAQADVGVCRPTVLFGHETDVGVAQVLACRWSPSEQSLLCLPWPGPGEQAL